MSLNRNEQMVYDYLQAQPDERRHWEGVVKREAARAAGQEPQPRFMESVEAIMHELGVPKSSFKKEEFG